MALEPITIDELLAELGINAAGDDGWYSVQELTEKWGCAQERVRILLRKAHAVGRLKTGRGTRQAIDGRAVKVPIYQITPTAKNKPNGRGR